MEDIKEYGDSDFLADNDRSIRDFRENEKESKRHIVKQMVKLRHNLQYNKHLLSVYLKAKAIFDKMVEEHRAQIHHLDEIYRHLSKLIHEQMTKNKPKKHERIVVMDDKRLIKELVNDKRNIGKLLSNMRKGLDKLMEIDTIIGTTIDKINDIPVIDDGDEDHKDDGEGEAVDGEGDDDDDDEDEADEDDDEADEDEADEDDADEDEDEADDDEADDDDDDDEADDDEADEDSASDDDRGARDSVVFY